MSDPIVTHADLHDLERLRRRLAVAFHNEEPLLDRLIAAAKADAPPLPEGWVLAEADDGSHRVLWHKDGWLNLYSDRSDVYRSVDYFKSVTPLRPTVTEADFGHAAVAAWSKYNGNASTWNHLPDWWLAAIRAAFAAAGIEVQP